MSLNDLQKINVDLRGTRVHVHHVLFKERVLRSVLSGLKTRGEFLERPENL